MLRLRGWLPRSLVGRVYALYTVTLVGFVLGGLAVFYQFQVSADLEEAQARTEALSAVLMPTISDSAVIGDYDTIRRTLERAVTHSPFSAATFIDLRGGVVRAPNGTPPDVAPPRWLLKVVSARLYDVNATVNVGGRDYGVLRLSLAAERIAGRLWQQTRIALALAIGSVVGGLVLIRFPLVRWLGKLSQVQDFERAMHSGELPARLPVGDEAPTEFRETFAVLGRAAASLQSQRAQAAVTLAAIADGVYTLDDGGRILFANPAACAMVGLQPESLLGHVAAEVLPQLFADGAHLEPWSARRALLTRAGEGDVVVESSLSPILSPEGRVVGHVLACRDVSEQHQLDQRLRAEMRSRESALVALRRVLEGLHVDGAGVAALPAQHDDIEAISTMISELVARLQERGEQLGAIFALSPDGFVSFDAERRANYVSPAFTRLTGIPEAQIVGADEGALEARLRELGTGPAWRGFEAMRQDLQQAPAGSPAAVRERLQLARPAQRVLEARLRIGATASISQVLSLRDVTHESEVDQMKTEFVSTAAHELRTPMTSIYGFAELMMQRAMAPEKQKQMLATIHRQSQLMIAIINELLDLARIESRRGSDFELQTLDLGVLVAELARDFKPPQDRAAPTLAVPPGRWEVCIDRNKMAQAVGNVLSNAYKYSPAGGRVEMELVREPGAGTPRIGLEVRDHGIGMSAAQLERVCERFYRADASGTIPGTGLGMSIVKEIVELHGGRLAIASQPGEGTRVTLWLPAAHAPHKPPATAPAAPDPELQVTS